MTIWPVSADVEGKMIDGVETNRITANARTNAPVNLIITARPSIWPNAILAAFLFQSALWGRLIVDTISPTLPQSASAELLADPVDPEEVRLSCNHLRTQK